MNDDNQSRRNAIAVCLAILFAACARTSSVLPDAGATLNGMPVESMGSSTVYADYEIVFSDGATRRVSNVALSRKVGAHGITWVSVRSPGADWLFKSTGITTITKIEGQARIPILSVAELPLRTRSIALQERASRIRGAVRSASVVNRGSCLDPTSILCDPACDASMPDCGTCPDCAGSIPYPSTAYGLCYGNVPCGLDSNGVGSGTISLFGPGMECDLDLVDGSAECYATTEPPDRNAPANLFSSFRITATDAILTCFNPVNPGWASGTYVDSVQGGVSRVKLPPVGPGSHTWDFPADFKLGSTPPRPPTGTPVMKMVYYKWGILNVIAQQAQGYCKSTG